jgi:crooked neck
MASIGGATARDSEIRLPKTMKVKNKAAASRQITAEQLLRESKEIQLEDDYKAPKTIITDPEELAEYRWVGCEVTHARRWCGGLGGSVDCTHKE